MGADLDRHRPFGQQPAHAPDRRVEGRGRVALLGPALAEDRVGGLGRRAAQRHAEDEEVPHEGRDDVVGGLLGGGDDDHPGRPAPRDQVAQRLGELGPLVLGPAAHVEGELVDGDDVEPEVAVPLDLAQARGEQDRVAAVHLGAEVLRDLDGAGHVGPDEVLGRARPRGELHLLAVEEGQADRGVEGGRGDEERQGHRLAGPGLAAEQQVALGQADRDRVAVLVDAEGERVPQRALAAPGHGGAGTDSGSRQRIERWASEALAGSRTTRTSRAPMVAASVSAASSICSAVKPGGRRRSQALAGRDRLGALDPRDQARGG